jgi:hypothetical protein
MNSILHIAKNFLRINNIGVYQYNLQFSVLPSALSVFHTAAFNLILIICTLSVFSINFQLSVLTLLFSVFAKCSFRYKQSQLSVLRCFFAVKYKSSLLISTL